jgi:uncharacterized protein YndB with AHSA1/START domain
MITCDTEVGIARSPAEVFAFLTNWAMSPRWLGRCVELRQTSPGPPAAGATLHYRYREPSREGTMDGRVAEYDPPARLVLAFTDSMADVEIIFALKESGGSTALRQTVSIEPKSWTMKLAGPMIRGATIKQIERDAAQLKQLLEAAPVA